MNSSKAGNTHGVTVSELREQAHLADREALSALMDDEASELEIRRLVRRLPEQPELLATWKRYQLIQALLHETTPVRAEVDLLPGIDAALADEPVPSRQGENRWSKKVLRLMGQGAIAASVAVCALVGVSKLELDQNGGNGQPVLAGEYNPSGLERTVNTQLDSAARTRLQQHVYQFSSTPRSNLQQAMPPAPLILELDLQGEELTPPPTLEQQP